MRKAHYLFFQESFIYCRSPLHLGFAHFVQGIHIMVNCALVVKHDLTAAADGFVLCSFRVYGNDGCSWNSAVVGSGSWADELTFYDLPHEEPTVNH